MALVLQIFLAFLLKAGDASHELYQNVLPANISECLRKVNKSETTDLKFPSPGDRTVPNDTTLGSCLKWLIGTTTLEPQSDGCRSTMSSLIEVCILVKFVNFMEGHSAG